MQFMKSFLLFACLLGMVLSEKSTPPPKSEAPQMTHMAHAASTGSSAAKEGDDTDTKINAPPADSSAPIDAAPHGRALAIATYPVMTTPIAYAPAAAYPWGWGGYRRIGKSMEPEGKNVEPEDQKLEPKGRALRMPMHRFYHGSSYDPYYAPPYDPYYHAPPPPPPPPRPYPYYHQGYYPPGHDYYDYPYDYNYYNR